jgi:hypothetical protein
VGGNHEIGGIKGLYLLGNEWEVVHFLERLIGVVFFNQTSKNKSKNKNKNKNK